MLGADIIRVPWTQVDEVGATVKLKAKARELGLGQGDDRQAEVVEKLPDS
jgi:hypothetical protein